MGESVTVEVMVSMHCKGCLRKVKKTLNKLDGVNSYNISFMEKKVTISGDITPQLVLKKLQKTGKCTSLLPLPQPEIQPQPPPPPPPPAEASPSPSPSPPPADTV